MKRTSDLNDAWKSFGQHRYERSMGREMISAVRSNSNGSIEYWCLVVVCRISVVTHATAAAATTNTTGMFLRLLA